MAIDMSQPSISAQQEVDVTIDEARNWFLSLKDHPERYRFETHMGIEFLEGTFGEAGARFKTREKFLFLTTDLRYELVEVDERSFAFRLLNMPWFHIWGVFRVKERNAHSVLLALEIGASQSLGRSFLAFYPVQNAVNEQVHREVAHIKQSMESLSA
jgi:hypothetical protein